MQLTALYTITLVSYANNLPWLTSLRTLKHGAHIWGFDRTLLWEERDFQNDDLASRLPPIGSPRCHCATFKPLMLMRATSKHAINDNDYVLWADSFLQSTSRKILCAENFAQSAFLQSTLRQVICTKYCALSFLSEVLALSTLGKSTLCKMHYAKYFALSIAQSTLCQVRASDRATDGVSD